MKNTTFLCLLEQVYRETKPELNPKERDIVARAREIPPETGVAQLPKKTNGPKFYLIDDKTDPSKRVPTARRMTELDPRPPLRHNGSLFTITHATIPRPLLIEIYSVN